MIHIVSEQRTVFRSGVGRRARLTKRAAYLDAAWQAWRAKYPCECEPEVGFACGEHPGRFVGEGGGEAVASARSRQEERDDYRRKVTKRLARWLAWRDRVAFSRSL